LAIGEAPSQDAADGTPFRHDAAPAQTKSIDHAPRSGRRRQGAIPRISVARGGPVPGPGSQPPSNQPASVTRPPGPRRRPMMRFGWKRAIVEQPPPGEASVCRTIGSGACPSVWGIVLVEHWRNKAFASQVSPF